MYWRSVAVRQLEYSSALFLMICILLAVPSNAFFTGDIRTYPETLVIGSGFTIIVPLSGDTCGLEARFFLDGNATGSRNVGCDAKSVESAPVGLINTAQECGPHVLRVDFLRSGEMAGNASAVVEIGKRPVVTFMEDQTGVTDLVIHFRDPRTNASIRGLNLEVYNVRKGPNLVQSYGTDASGDLVVRSEEQGAYYLSIDDSDYCGRFVFYVKKPLSIDGPYPPNPRVSEIVSLTVPPGVGMKVIDPAGAFYASLNASYTGSANFTMEKPGNYTIVIGESSMDYWGRNVSITVSDKPEAKIAIERTENVIRTKEVIVSVSDAKGPLSGAKVIFQTPESLNEERTADANGSIAYVPQSVGRYALKLSESDYKASEASFFVVDSLIVDYAPREPLAGQEISVYVRDQTKSLVEGATVSVPGVVHGLTGRDGRFSFSVASPGNYTIEASRADALSASQNLTVTSRIILEASPSETEIGGVVRISVLDSAGGNLDPDIKVIGPGGESVSVTGTFTTGKVGAHRVTASKEGFIGAEANFTVTPHPLDEPSVGVMGDVMVINVSSRRSLLAGMFVTVIGPAGKEELMTSANGSAQWKIDADGRVRIIANPGRVNPDYSESEVSYAVQKRPEVKSFNLQQGVMILAAAALCVAILLLVLARKRGGRSKAGGRRGDRARSSNASISRKR